MSTHQQVSMMKVHDQTQVKTIVTVLFLFGGFIVTIFAIQKLRTQTCNYS